MKSTRRLNFLFSHRFFIDGLFIMSINEELFPLMMEICQILCYNKTFVTVAYLVMFSASSEIKCTVLNFFLEYQYVNVACCLTLTS